MHREFHFGPDPTTNEIAAQNVRKKNFHLILISIAFKKKKKNLKNFFLKILIYLISGMKGQTSPPESTFAKLAPSRNRYTLLKDEL